MSRVESDFLKCAGPENGGGDDGGGDGRRIEAQEPYSRAERSYEDIVKTRTSDEFRTAIDDAAPVNYDSNIEDIHADSIR